jgi:TatD DNase family protein
MLTNLVDTHCHLTHPRFAADLEGTIERARAAGISRMITIGTSVADARRCLELAALHPDILHCSAGIDPHAVHEAGAAFDTQFHELETLLRTGAFSAVGEIGLEYHHRLDDKPRQKACLEVQLELAIRLDLPVVIHSRDAHPDMIEVLSRHPDCRGVIHSFTGTPADARAFLALGWYLSFNGMVTFKANDILREALKVTPNDRLLIETDSPYLAPVPLRGQRCEPAQVVHTLALIAEVRGQRIEDMAAWSTRNAELLFRLPGGRTLGP